MKEVAAKIYHAFDDTPFLTAAACLEYEAANWRNLLVGLTLSEIDDALARTNETVADAIERAAKQIARIRLGGRLRAPYERKRKVFEPDNAGALANVAASRPNISASPEDRNEAEDEAA